MVSARHVRPILEFEPSMQGRIKSGPLHNSGAMTSFDISSTSVSAFGRGGGGCGRCRSAVDAPGGRAPVAIAARTGLAGARAG